MAVQQPTDIPRPWASNGGQYTQVPDTTSDAGRASWSVGFPPETSLPTAQGGIPPNRLDFQGVLNALSAHIVYQQAGGQYAWNNSTDYAVGALVLGANGSLYVAIAQSGPNSGGAVNPTATGQTVWATVATGGQAYLPLSGGTMTGTIKTATGNLAGAEDINLLRIYNGIDIQACSYLALLGSQYTPPSSSPQSVAGSAELVAGTTTDNRSRFTVQPKTGAHPHGQAILNGLALAFAQDIPSAAGILGSIVVSSNANGYYVRLGQLQICWGESTTGTSHNFPQPFSQKPALVASMDNGAGDPATTSSLTASAYTIINANRNDYDGDSTSYACWIAIGPWY